MDRLINIIGILLGSFVYSVLVLRGRLKSDMTWKELIPLLIVLIFMLFGAVGIVREIVELLG